MAIIDEVKGFFRALEFSVEERDRDFVVAERAGLGGDRERRCVWVLTRKERQGRQAASLEDEYLTRFRGIAGGRLRGAHLHLLVETTEGLSSDFRVKCREYAVRVQVPVQFFDMPFKHEVATMPSMSAVGRLVSEARDYQQRRVPQAYERGDGCRGNDLVPDLLADIDDFTRTSQPRVWFITAPAGYGKSILFSTLFGQLYERFTARKREHRVYPKPIPMLPAHIREAAGPNVMGLIDAFLRTDIAATATRALFDWMLDNRYAVWMLDGLDEVITRDDTFLNYLEDRVTSPNARPGVVISLRDSLFESNRELQEFLEHYRSVTVVYRLRPWDRSALRTFVWLRVEGRLPRDNEDTSRVREMMRGLAENIQVQQLAATPFYANLIVDIALQSGTARLRNELDVMDVAVTEMCRREYGKKVLREDVLPLPRMREWLEELAAVSYDTGGVSVADLRDLAGLAAALAERELGEDEEKELVEQIVMAPFIQRSEATGRVELTHEILGDYLAALKFIREFRSRSPLFVSRLSRRRWPSDSILFKVLAAGLNDQVERLAHLAEEEALPPEGFRNLVQLLAMLPGGDRLLRSGRPRLNGARLQDVSFAHLNLDGVSFRACDLTGADFTGASLRGARLEGAVLHNTRLIGLAEGALAGAAFGGTEHFYSVIVDGGRRIEDAARFEEWIRSAQGSSAATATGPCPSARQLLHMFRKFIHVDGQGRRDSLDKRAIVRGHRVPGAAEYEAFVEAALEFGYLVTGRFDRVERPSGGKYGEMVSFVKTQALSPGLRSLLDSVCRLPGCRHTSG